jgi:hypothetical protein
MIVYNFDIMCVPIRPAEANAPLIVDTDTILPFAIASEPFKTVARRYPKIFQSRRCVKHQELA